MFCKVKGKGKVVCVLN